MVIPLALGPKALQRSWGVFVGRLARMKVTVSIHMLPELVKFPRLVPTLNHTSLGHFLPTHVHCKWVGYTWKRTFYTQMYVTFWIRSSKLSTRRYHACLWWRVLWGEHAWKIGNRAQWLSPWLHLRITWRAFGKISYVWVPLCNN